MAEQKREVNITRIIDAPRGLVFKAWTDPEQLALWWGPRGFTAPTCELDLKPGGKIRIQMEHPGFPNHWMGGEFLEVSAPARLVFISRAFESTDGQWGLEALNTITFEDVEGKTKLTVHAVLNRLSPEYTFAGDGMNQGWSESLCKLDELISSLTKN